MDLFLANHRGRTLQFGCFVRLIRSRRVLQRWLLHLTECRQVLGTMRELRLIKTFQCSVAVDLGREPADPDGCREQIAPLRYESSQEMKR